MTEVNDKVELLINYIRDKLDTKGREKVKALLESDSDTAELYAVLKNLLEDRTELQNKSLTDAAQKLADRIYEDFQRQRGSPELPMGVTVFDSRLLPLPEGVRPASVEVGRVKYRINGLTLEISLYPVSSDSFEVIGQVSGVEESTSFEVQLTGKRKKYAVTTDRFHLFRYERIPSGQYKLSLLKEKKEIGVVNLDL